MLYLFEECKPPVSVAQSTMPPREEELVGHEDEDYDEYEEEYEEADEYEDEEELNAGTCRLHPAMNRAAARAGSIALHEKR